MRTLSLLCLIPAPAALAGCLSFAEPLLGSACAKSSTELVWLNRPASVETERRPTGYYDRLLTDPALSTGVVAGGDLRFELRAAGPQLVEVFLVTTEEARHSFVLEAGAAVIDARYRDKPGPVRLRPKSGARYLALLGIIQGGSAFIVRTDSPRYTLSAVRWTPRAEFESALVSKWRERARYWVENPFPANGERGRTARRNYLEQLGDRLALSEQPEVRREAVVMQTRAAYWAAAENHEPRDIDRTAELFLEGLKLAPGDKILREMISSSCLALNVGARNMPEGPFCKEVAPVPWSVEVPAPPPGAPAWAIEQRKLAARMDAITRWWVEKRQQPNGELGGGWGDDVEILRHWGPESLGLGSEVALRGIQRLADGLWASGTLSNGYDLRVSDVEHSSEPSTDTVPLRLAILPDDAEARARLKTSAACAYNWIAQQPDGRWRFRGSWFNCKQFDPKPERAVDVYMNLRAMGPALWHAYLTRDPKMIDLLVKWATAWVEGMRSTAHGKPVGVFPSAVRSADGSYLIASDRWDKPDVEWDYYQWSGAAQSALTSLLLAVHDLTGDARWLEAAGESFRILDRCSAFPELCKQIASSPEAFYEWRRLSGDARYDKAFGYAPRRSLKETLALLTRQARETEARLAVNFEMWTSEVLYTDRVYYRLPAEYRWYLFGGEAPRGDHYPTFAVTWPTVKGAFARAVLDATSTSLKLHLYNFEREELRVPLRAWRLQPGRYRWQGGEVNVSARAQVIELPLPPRKETTITLERIP